MISTTPTQDTDASVSSANYSDHFFKTQQMSISPREDFDPLNDNLSFSNEHEDDYGEESATNSMEFIDNSDFDKYGSTPTNIRFNHRMKEKDKKSKKEYNKMKDLVSSMNSSSLRPNMRLRMGHCFENEIDMSDNDQIQEVVDQSLSADSNFRKKKETKNRKIDRKMKPNINDILEGEPRNSLSASLTAAAILICKNKYQSIYSTPLAKSLETGSSKSKSLPLHTSPSMIGIEISQDKLDFYNSFAILIDLGKGRDKPETRPLFYNRQISSEQEMWRSEYGEVIWLELQAKVNRVAVFTQDCNFLDHRRTIGDILHELINFRTSIHGNVPLSPDNKVEASENCDPNCVCGVKDKLLAITCEASISMFETCLHCHVRQLKVVHEEVTRLMKKLEWAESLYPTRKALASENPEFAVKQVQQRIGTLCLWLNIIHDICYNIKLVAQVIEIKNAESSPWAFLDLEELDCLDGFQTLDEELDSESCDGESDDDDGTYEDSSEEDNNQSNSLKHTISSCKKTVKFDSSVSLTDAGASDTNNFQSNNLAHQRDSRTSFGSVTSVNENPTMTSIYRHFVDRTLKKTGMRKLRSRLKSLFDGTLSRTRLTLLKPKSTDSTNASQSGSAYKCDDKPIKVLSTDEDLTMHGTWSRQFQDMHLPSFRPMYLFLARIPLDVIHECLKLRLEQRLEKDPSFFILRQLIHECKEVLNAAVTLKQYYLHMVGGIGCELDFEMYLEKYEDDLKQMLDVYFDYIQSWMNTLQQLPEMSKQLKNFLEEEWNFIKKVCPNVRGGEANACNRFCIMASSLLRSISDFLDNRIDECINKLFENTTVNENYAADEEQATAPLPRSKSYEFRQCVIKLCRDIKVHFNEARERSSKAIGFAKILHKDLEVAAEFSIISSEDLLYELYLTEHVRIISPQRTNYMMFIPKSIASNQERICQLLNVTCGREDISTEDNLKELAYLVLVKLDEDFEESSSCIWQGPVVNVEPTAETTIALVHIKVDGLLLVVIHSTQLSETRREFLSKFVKRKQILRLVDEQMSCHQSIAESLNDLKTCAIDLRERIVEAITRVDKKLNLDELVDMDESEKNNIQILYRETMHQCYNFGFEYHRELARLVSGEVRSKLSPAMVDFATQWMKFVTEKSDRGRGVRPRWAGHGLDFLKVVVEPRTLSLLDDAQWKSLTQNIHNCIFHVIGDIKPPMRSNGDQGNSPDRSTSRSFARNMSVPGTKHQSLMSPSHASRSGNTTPLSAQSLPPPYLCTGVKKSISAVGMNATADDGDTGINFDAKMQDLGEGEMVTPSKKGPAKKTIRELEDERTEKLRKNKMIGRPADRKHDTDFGLKIRRVNFRWQRGIKIGEGQFGKVYTAVNIDTGVLMAMKEIRLQPNEQALKQVHDEIKIFEGINDPSLVHYYGIEFHRDEMIIFMEYCQNGTIEDLSKQGLDEPLIKNYTSQILNAVYVLHEKGIVHRDIKGANIFLMPDQSIKLGDFGCAVKLKNHTTMPGELKAYVGTPAYMAPEVIRGDASEVCGRAADIWSLGCVVIEMATGKSPWPELENRAQIFFKVGMGGMPCIPHSLSGDGRVFLTHCFEPDPEKRWTADQLRNHQFVNVLSFVDDHTADLDP